MNNGTIAGEPGVEPKPRVALVTGAGGFIGRHCLPLLAARGFEVHCVTRGSSPSKDLYRWHRADLLDAVATETLLGQIRATHLLHLAWITTPGEYWNSDSNDRWAEASTRLASSFLERGGVRLTIAGSCAEYDWTDGWCSEERTPLRPASAYGRSKLRLFEALQDSSTLQGKVAWARIFFPFGPGEHRSRLVASVCHDLMLGRTAKCTFGFQQRDFLYVADVAAALVALLDSQVEGAINIASGRPIVVRDLVLKLAERLNAADRVELGAIDSQEEQAPLVAADVRRLRQRLAWRPQFTLDQALDRTLAWWSEQTTQLAAPTAFSSV